MEMMTSIAAMAPLDLAALAAIVLIGLPHGALDGAIAIHLGFTRKLLHFMRFLALYIAMAGLVVGAWLLAPTAWKRRPGPPRSSGRRGARPSSGD